MPWVLVDVALAALVLVVLVLVALRLYGRVKGLLQAVKGLGEVAAGLADAAARVQPPPATGPGAGPRLDTRPSPSRHRASGSGA